VATDAVLDFDGTGDTMVIGTGRTASAPAAAVLNSTYIQGLRAGRFPSPGATALLPGHSLPPLPDLILDMIAGGGALPRLAARGYLPAELADILRSSEVQMRGAGSGA
jgi:hypothetical protein